MTRWCDRFLFPLRHHIANKHNILFISERKQGLRESLLDKIKTESALGKHIMYYYVKCESSSQLYWDAWSARASHKNLPSSLHVPGLLRKINELNDAPSHYDRLLSSKKFYACVEYVQRVQEMMFSEELKDIGMWWDHAELPDVVSLTWRSFCYLIQEHCLIYSERGQSRESKSAMFSSMNWVHTLCKEK